MQSFIILKAIERVTYQKPKIVVNQKPKIVVNQKPN